MSSQRFCRQCGKELQDNAAFCEFCGAPVDRNDYGHGLNQQADPNVYPVGYNQNPYPNVQTRPAKPAKAARGGTGAKIIAIAVGLLLIILGARVPLLALAGKTTTATVTSVRRSTNTDNTEHSYQIYYSYSDSNGRSRSSSYHMSRVYDSSKLPGKGSLLKIRYFPAIPWISIPADQKNAGVGALILIGLGVFIIVLGLSGKVSFSRNKRRY